MNAMTKTKPMFEVGKRYRTRQGWFVKIREIDRESDTYPLGGMFDRLTGNQWWTAGGRYRAYTECEHEHDLMPGAIEDEKPEGRSTPYTNEERLDEAYRRIEAQTSVIAGMAAKIEAMQDQLTRHANRISSHHDKIDADGREIVDLEERVDNIEKHCEAMQGAREVHTQQIGTLQASVKSLLLGVSDLYAERNAHAKIISDRQPKPTIKGGWVNVYHGDFGKAAITAMHSSREDADAWDKGDQRIRRACIQIPDITEGEGL